MRQDYPDTRRLDGAARDMGGALARILEIQAHDGAIAWFEDGPWDPWNHTECLLALNAMGQYEAADRAMACLVERQRPNGAWAGEYGNVLPLPDRDHIARRPAPVFQDTNFAAYPAVGLWHDTLVRRDRSRAFALWPMVQNAMAFVCGLQGPQGDICWSLEARGTGAEDALLAGNASIYKSLGCAIALGQWLGKPVIDLQQARERLREALRWRPGRFDRAGTSRAEFAMDWYYPVLAGALQGDEARAHLASQQVRFVDPGLGCRCVADEPWVTVAESAELALTYLGVGNRKAASALLAEQHAHRDTDGAFWMGWQHGEAIFWPREKPSWTQAAMILATEALKGHTPASRLLVSDITLPGPVRGDGANPHSH